MHKKTILFLLVAILSLAGCARESTPTAVTAVPDAVLETPTSPPTVEPEPVVESIPASHLLISEVLLSAPGNNNYEFIELYNTGYQAIDLEGWSLWYLLNSGQEEKLIYAWEKSAEVPGLGHYLLTREGQEIDIPGDATYSVALFESKGGLRLQDRDDETVDALGWGDAPENFFAGEPAAAPAAGTSLERLPGGDKGNAAFSGDNSADMIQNPSPMPQNSGSEITPLPAERLTIDIHLPAVAEPGTDVELLVEVTNLTGAPATDLVTAIPLPENFELGPLPAGATEIDGRIEWHLDTLAEGGSESIIIRLMSPWTYRSSHIRGSYVEAGNWPLRAYAPPLSIAVAGGSIPIATARTLTGKTVTVEGIATMYTDAFYAGSTGTKFYLEDETRRHPGLLPRRLWGWSTWT